MEPVDSPLAGHEPVRRRLTGMDVSEQPAQGCCMVVFPRSVDYDLVAVNFELFLALLGRPSGDSDSV